MAEARFFVTGEGGGGRGIIARAQGTSLVGAGGSWVSVPRKFSNLEAPKCFFQHLS